MSYYRQPLRPVTSCSGSPRRTESWSMPPSPMRLVPRLRTREDGGLMHRDDPNLFPLGRKIVSRNALAVLGEAGVSPNRLFERHAQGDWGVVESKSWYMNRMAVDSGYGCVSSFYVTSTDVLFAIVLHDDLCRVLRGAM